MNAEATRNTPAIQIIVEGGIVQNVYGLSGIVEVLYDVDDGPDAGPDPGDEVVELDGIDYTVQRGPMDGPIRATRRKER